MRYHVSQPIVVGSRRVVSSPLPETSLLARSSSKAERERYFVFGESLRPPEHPLGAPEATNNFFRGSSGETSGGSISTACFTNFRNRLRPRVRRARRIAISANMRVQPRSAAYREGPLIGST
jgi:hypothetical protein